MDALSKGLRKWRLLAVCLALSTLLVSCWASAPGSSPLARFESPQRRPAAPVISVLAPSDARLVPVIEQLQRELSEDFDVLVTELHPNQTSPEALGLVLSEQRPKAVVLLNNSTARLYRKWVRGVQQPPVAVILMASFARELQRTIPNSVGIAYEVPAVTSLSGLRALGARVVRVGVVHRRVMRELVRAEERLARVERISFVREELPNDFEVRDLKAALVRLRQAEVDVLWLPNDNHLLTRRLLAGAWLPYLEQLRLPVVVGVPSLVRSQPAFGVYAAIPDPAALAIQAADLILELADADWSITAPAVRLPLSARTYVSAPLGLEYGVDAEKLQKVDVVVGED